MRRQIDSWNDDTSFTDMIQDIKDTFKLKTDIIAIKVENKLSYSNGTWYDCTSDLYEWLDDRVQCEDCKNGCQLYEEDNGDIYFCITGSNYYDKETDEYRGTDEVHVYFKDFVW